ncbi:Complement component 1 Q subcomponent-binding protein, mitochondrial [Ancistrocladus abbreviatus]
MLKTSPEIHTPNLNCSFVLGNQRRTILLFFFSPLFLGHYIINCRYDTDNDEFEIRDPASLRKYERVSSRYLDKARKSFDICRGDIIENFLPQMLIIFRIILSSSFSQMHCWLHMCKVVYNIHQCLYPNDLVQHLCHQCPR